MYINKPPRRTSSPRRIIVYLIVIAAGLLVLRFQDNLRQPFIPTPTPTRAAQSYAAEAEAHYEAGRLDQAADAYIQAAALEPNRIDILVALSRIFALTDHTEEALQRAQRAVQLAPNSVEANAALAMAYDWRGTWLLLHGRDDDAQSHYRSAVSYALEALLIDPNYPEAHAYLAEAYIDLGELADAIAAAQTAVELGPEQPDVQRAVAYVREARGNYSGAAEAYREAIKYDPTVPYLWVALGRNYRILSVLSNPAFFTDALEAFQRAIQIDPNYGEAYDELGWSYYNAEDYRQAAETLEQAIQIAPDSWSAYSHLGISYYSNRNYEGATETLPRAIELMNKTFDAEHYCVQAQSRACDRLVEAYYTLGLSWYYREDCEESYRLFDRALELRPEEPNALEGIRLCDEALSETEP